MWTSRAQETRRTSFVNLARCVLCRRPPSPTVTSEAAAPRASAALMNDRGLALSWMSRSRDLFL